MILDETKSTVRKTTDESSKGNSAVYKAVVNEYQQETIQASKRYCR